MTLSPQTVGTVYGTPALDAVGTGFTYFSFGSAFYRRALPVPDNGAFLLKCEDIRALRQRLAALCERCVSLGLDYDPPSSAAIQAAGAILDACVGFPLTPSRVVASAEGGASVVFLLPTGRASLECLNSGEFVGSIRRGNQSSDVWEFSSESIYAAVARVCDQLAG